MLRLSKNGDCIDHGLAWDGMDGMGMAWGISHPHFLEPLGAGCVRWTSALCHLGTC